MSTKVCDSTDVAGKTADGANAEQPKEMSKSALKKLKKQAEEEERKRKKAEEKLLKQKDQSQASDAPVAVIELDPSLPEPVTIKIRDGPDCIGKRVKIFGFVHRFRKQSSIIFC